ncbi:TIGR01458 family HAD-type hydrolase [Sulfurovum sp. zt1-1]|uniref:Haloacid dehalogenase-like hydrolase domain-containing protein 2 n=1 Tax=Sulfurovum zhangzhouensis TaxID=3019067 RepID=A0ABT7QUQ6_9BACT|nr:TIGR01458 family HAD-type hydrolase [Sulfurovum zhangzhouensis]MDM5270565.1 TIGR01458 family HAD-type hydrolase [Sulfurovum zhangzhouensis]
MLLKDIKGIMTDIGGVLYVGSEPIQGAPKALNTLRSRYPLRLISNTTRSTPFQIVKHLQKLGFTIDESEMYTALAATRDYVRAKKYKAYTLLTDEANVYFAELRSNDQVDCVVVADAHKNFHFDTMNQAFRHIEEGAELIGAAKSRYFKDSDGKLTMGTGSWIAALEFASGKEATIIGKPSASFFHLVAESLGMNPSEILMVGDDIISDIGGAQKAGFKTALVKTGKFKESDLHSDIKPDIICDSFTDLVEQLLD